MKKQREQPAKPVKSHSLAGSMIEYVGKDVAEVIRELAGRPDYSEFKLAEALGMELNATRNLLYKLHSLNLASFIKRKDNKIGWYIYYWTFHDERVDLFLLNEKKHKIEALKERAAAERAGIFYSCANKCVRLGFDNVFELSFRCPECGELLGQDSSKFDSVSLADEIERLRQKIKKLEFAIAAEKIKNLDNASTITREKGKDSSRF